MAKQSGLKAAETAQAATDRLLKKYVDDAAVGIALDDGKYSIYVYLQSPLPEGIELPKEIAGHALNVKMIGKVRAVDGSNREKKSK